MEGNRPTQSDVARGAGVTQATVSFAFKHHPRIPAATRERILRVAEKLGYVPDPMLSALAAYAKRRRPAAFQGTIAWVVNTRAAAVQPVKRPTYRDYPREGYNWADVPAFHDYLQGATQRAKRHGFRLETFDLAKRGMTPARLAGILRARNIPGVLLCPQPGMPADLELPWEEFSAVAYGLTFVRPALHSVVATQFRATMQTMQQLRARGYRRIGFAFSNIHDSRADHHYVAAYLTEQFLAGQLPGRELVPYEEYSLAELPRWLKKYRPDAIITGDYGILEVLQELKVRVPDDLGVACPLLPAPAGDLSGVFEDSVQIGEAGVDLLVAMIQRGERGIPRTPHRLLVECQWVEGRSLRPLLHGAALPPLQDSVAIPNP